jgi:excinuclease UvrABC nuclease subunit
MTFKEFIKMSAIKKMGFLKWDHKLFHPSHLDNLTNNHFGGGIYRMYDKHKEIIYVGKSNDIHRRLLQHIGKRTNSAYFIDQVEHIEYFVENNPIFQTLLEGIFIAYHKPKFNDEVKDAAKMEGLVNDTL